VALDRAHRVQSNESICAWECGQEFFRVEWGCANCSTQQQACPPGQRWQACSERADAGCAACPDLRLSKGSYAANEQWVEPSADECASECRAGFYNDTTQYAEGRCRRCWDRTELALHASLEQQFFALSACNATSNARWAPCAQEPGARVIGSDPGFTGRCEIECVEGDGCGNEGGEGRKKKGGGGGDGGRGGGDGGGGGADGDGGGDGGAGGGGGAKQVETVPATPVRVVAKVQTVAPETKTLVRPEPSLSVFEWMLLDTSATVLEQQIWTPPPQCEAALE
jgi:hypothetical protein